MNSSLNRIIPCLWYDEQAEEAARFYASIFKNGSVGNVTYYQEGGMMPEGLVLTTKFQLAGRDFIALNGGPIFKFTPATSFFVGCETTEELATLWEKLVEGGSVLMPLDTYPFFEKFGWLQDKYGLSWQLGLCGVPQYINPYLLFVGEQHGKAEKAIRFYQTVFSPSEITEISKHGKNNPGETEGTVLHAEFSLLGLPFMAMDSGLEHPFAFTEAVSFYLYCQTQEEIDYYWEKLSADGETGPCGWLKDAFGIWWQIVPESIERMMEDCDIRKTKKMMDAMMKMGKLHIETLEKAFNQ